MIPHQVEAGLEAERGVELRVGAGLAQQPAHPGHATQALQVQQREDLEEHLAREALEEAVLRGLARGVEDRPAKVGEVEAKEVLGEGDEVSGANAAGVHGLGEVDGNTVFGFILL